MNTAAISRKKASKCGNIFPIHPIFCLRGNIPGTTSFYFVPQHDSSNSSAVSGDEIGMLHIWKLRNRRIKRSFPPYPLHEEFSKVSSPIIKISSFSEPSEIFSQSCDGRFNFWDLKSEKHLFSFNSGNFGFCKAEVLFKSLTAKSTYHNYGGFELYGNSTKRLSDDSALHSNSKYPGFENCREIDSLEATQSSTSFTAVNGKSSCLAVSAASGNVGVYDILRCKTAATCSSFFDRYSIPGVKRPDLEISPFVGDLSLRKCGKVMAISALPALNENVILLGYESCILSLMDVRFPRNSISVPISLLNDELSRDMLNCLTVHKLQIWSGTAFGNVLSVDLDKAGNLKQVCSVTSQNFVPRFLCEGKCGGSGDSSSVRCIFDGANSNEKLLTSEETNFCSDSKMNDAVLNSRINSFQKLSQYRSQEKIIGFSCEKENYFRSNFTEKLAGIADLAVRLDGKQLVAGCWDHLVRLFCVQSHRLVVEIQYHSSAVTCVEFCPETATFVSATRNSSKIPVWRFL